MSQNQQQPLNTNQLEALDTLGSLHETQSASKATQPTYKRARTKRFPPLPIPAKNCIPTMASAEQTKLYEAQFAGVPSRYLGRQTISDLLKIYSSSDNEQIHIGKISFLHGFFQKIIAKNMNLDVAILCRDLETQHYLFSALLAISLNCDYAGSYSHIRDTFGVIVRIRETTGKPATPITQATNKVDIVLVYDSAISLPKRVLDQFTGHDRPPAAHISTVDSADIRCYQHSTLHKKYSWYTKYKNIQNTQEIFHQANRRASLQDFVAWNDYIATEVAEWASSKQKIPYEFFRPPKKHAASNAYNKWGGGHPLSSFRINSQSNVAILPPVATTNDTHPSPSPPSQPFYLPSSSSTLMQTDPTPSTASATADSFMQAFDFKSILDRALKEFDEDANRFFNKI